MGIFTAQAVSHLKLVYNHGFCPFLLDTVWNRRSSGPSLTEGVGDHRLLGCEESPPTNRFISKT
jgi:hypothetical protein